MRGPHRFVLRMALFLAIVVAIAIVLGPSLLNAFLRNPAFNGIIFGLLIAGIAYISDRSSSLNRRAPGSTIFASDWPIGT